MKFSKFHVLHIFLFGTCLLGKWRAVCEPVNVSTEVESHFPHTSLHSGRNSSLFDSHLNQSNDVNDRFEESQLPLASDALSSLNQSEFLFEVRDDTLIFEINAERSDGTTIPVDDQHNLDSDEALGQSKMNSSAVKPRYLRSEITSASGKSFDLNHFQFGADVGLSWTNILAILCGCILLPGYLFILTAYNFSLIHRTISKYTQSLHIAGERGQLVYQENDAFLVRVPSFHVDSTRSSMTEANLRRPLLSLSNQQETEHGLVFPELPPHKLSPFILVLEMALYLMMILTGLLYFLLVSGVFKERILLGRTLFGVCFFTAMFMSTGFSFSYYFAIYFDVKETPQPVEQEGRFRLSKTRTGLFCFRYYKTFLFLVLSFFVAPIVAAYFLASPFVKYAFENPLVNSLSKNNIWFLPLPWSHLDLTESGHYSPVAVGGASLCFNSVVFLVVESIVMIMVCIFYPSEKRGSFSVSRQPGLLKGIYRQLSSLLAVTLYHVVFFVALIKYYREKYTTIQGLADLNFLMKFAFSSVVALAIIAMYLLRYYYACKKSKAALYEGLSTDLVLDLPVQDFTKKGGDVGFAEQSKLCLVHPERSPRSPKAPIHLNSFRENADARAVRKPEQKNAEFATRIPLAFAAAHSSPPRRRVMSNVFDSHAEFHAKDNRHSVPSMRSPEEPMFAEPVTSTPDRQEWADMSAANDNVRQQKDDIPANADFQNEKSVTRKESLENSHWVAIPSAEVASPVRKRRLSSQDVALPDVFSEQSVTRSVKAVSSLDHQSLPGRDVSLQHESTAKQADSESKLKQSRVAFVHKFKESIDQETIVDMAKARRECMDGAMACHEESELESYLKAKKEEWDLKLENWSALQFISIERHFISSGFLMEDNIQQMKRAVNKKKHETNKMLDDLISEVRVQAESSKMLSDNLEIVKESYLTQSMILEKTLHDIKVSKSKRDYELFHSYVLEDTAVRTGDIASSARAEIVHWTREVEKYRSPNLTKTLNLLVYYAETVIDYARQIRKELESSDVTKATKTILR